jgi:hypothetical protein
LLLLFIFSVLIICTGILTCGEGEKTFKTPRGLDVHEQLVLVEYSDVREQDEEKETQEWEREKEPTEGEAGGPESGGDILDNDVSE